MLSEKQILREELQLRFEDFLYSDKKQFQQSDISSLPNRLFSETFSKFTKRQIPLGKGWLEFIDENSESKFFLWRTQPQQIRKAIKCGILSYDALTSKILFDLGHYYHSVNQRAYNHGVISNKHALKIALLNLCQSNIEALEPFERCINQPIHSIKDAKAELLQLLKNLKQTTQHNFAAIENQKEEFCAYDAEIHLKWQQQYQAFYQRCNDFENSIENTSDPKDLKALCRAYHPNGILAFIKRESIDNIRHIQEYNQNISYSSTSLSLMRGDLHSVCEDALKTINDTHLDYHDPILPSHQGIFTTEKTGEEIIVNFSHLEKDHKKRQIALMALCQIEGVDKIEKSTAQNCYQLHSENNSAFNLKTTSFTKWSQNNSKMFIAARFMCWCWNIIAGLFFGLTFDLFSGLISGLSGKKTEAVAHKFQIHLIPPASQNSFYGFLQEQFRSKKYSLGTLIGFKLVTFCKNIYIDLTRGAATTAAQYRLELWDNLKADYYLGHRKSKKFSIAMQKVAKQIETIETSYKQYHTNINAKAPDSFKRFSYTEKHCQVAKTAYPLNDGEWLDLMNSAVYGLKAFADAFSHPIHNKNPFLGALFCTTYAITGLTILNPELMKFLPNSWITHCNSLADALSKGRLTGAIGASSMQSQLFTASLEGALNGNASWLAMGGKLFESDPSNILVYSTMAVGLGALIAFKLNIPIISEAIRDDLGSVPLPSLGIAGTKIGLLLIHLLEEREKKITPKDKAAVQARIEKLLTTYYQQHSPKQDKLSDKKVNEVVKLLDSVSIPGNLHLPAISEIDSERLSFLFYLQNKAYFLPKLDQQNKRIILAQAQLLFTNKPEVSRCIEKLLNPPTHQSIFTVTLTTALNYIPLLFRCITTPITHCSQPFIDLQAKIKKDLTRCYNALGNALHGVASVTKIFFKMIYEIIINESAARVESLIRADKHHVSASSYKLMRNMDSNFEAIKSHTAYPLNSLKAQCNGPLPAALLQKPDYFIYDEEESDSTPSLQSTSQLKL